MMVLLYFFFALNLLYWIGLFYIPGKDLLKNGLAKFHSSLLGKVTVYFQYLLAVPMYQVCFYFFFCQNNARYYVKMDQGVCKNDWLTILNSIVSTLILIFGTIILYFLGDMVRDFNPFSSSPLTSP